MLAKSSPLDDGKTQEELDAAIRQIVSKAVVSDEGQVAMRKLTHFLQKLI